MTKVKFSDQLNPAEDSPGPSGQGTHPPPPGPAEGNKPTDSVKKILDDLIDVLQRLEDNVKQNKTEDDAAEIIDEAAAVANWIKAVAISDDEVKPLKAASTMQKFDMFERVAAALTTGPHHAGGSSNNHDAAYQAAGVRNHSGATRMPLPVDSTGVNPTGSGLVPRRHIAAGLYQQARPDYSRISHHHVIPDFLASNFGKQPASSTTNMTVRRGRVGHFANLHLSSPLSRINSGSQMETRRQDVLYKISEIAKGSRAIISQPVNRFMGMKILILDGASSGRLIFDIATRYREAQVIVLNSQLSVAAAAVMPPTVSFRKGNPTLPFTSFDPAADDSYDLILLISMFPHYKHSIMHLLLQCRISLRSGGCIEIHETFPGIVSCASTLPAPAHQALYDAMARVVPTNAVAKLGGLDCIETLRRAGFDQVGQKAVKCPSNPHSVAIGKMIHELSTSETIEVMLGELTRVNAFENKGLENLADKYFVRGLGWTQNKADAWVTEMAFEMEQPGIKAYTPMYFTWARKKATQPKPANSELPKIEVTDTDLEIANTLRNKYSGYGATQILPIRTTASQGQTTTSQGLTTTSQRWAPIIQGQNMTTQGQTTSSEGQVTTSQGHTTQRQTSVTDDDVDDDLEFIKINVPGFRG